MNDSQFLSFFDLARPSMREAKSLLDSGKQHEAALVAARQASEGPARGVFRGQDIAATRALIQKHCPRGIEPDRYAAELWLRSSIPDAKEIGFVEECRRGGRARTGRKRGNETLGLALLYATTGERSWADAAIRAGVKSAAEMQPLPVAPGADPDAGVREAKDHGTQYPGIGWHPYSNARMTHEWAHRIKYWLQAWPLLEDALNDEDRLAWMKTIVLAARDMLRSNRYELPFNITLHSLLPALQAAIAFPALREAAEWTNIVAERLERDFSAAPFLTPDGYTRESVGYHNVNTRLLTIGHLLLMRALGRNVPAVEKACHDAYAVQSLFTCPDGSVWLIGDTGVMGYHEHWQDAHESLHLGAALFNRPDWKAMTGSPAGTQPELLNLWLMGPEGIERWAKWPEADLKRRTYANAHAPQSCFHVLRSGTGVDAHAGILSFGMEFNHAHHDKGQVLLYGLGRHLLSDPGHPGYGHGDMDPGFSVRIHGCAAPIRRSPMGPRTDYADYARSLGAIESERASVAMAEHDYYENYVVRRALALVSPSGRSGAEAFWLIWDRIVWKRGWPGKGIEPYEMVDTVFPLNAPGCGAKVSADNRTVWSQYDGPGGPPFVQRGPMRAECREGNELSDSDANIQITRLESKGSGATIDCIILPGQTAAPGAPAAVPRPLASFRWRGWLPHASAYALVPFRGVRESEFAAVSGECDGDSIRAAVTLPQGIVSVVVSGLDHGKLSVEVSA